MSDKSAASRHSDEHDPSEEQPDIYALNADEVDTETLARDIAHLTWDVKGLNTTVLDLRGRVSYTDFVIVTTATSERQINAIARHVQNSLADAGYKPVGVEGVDGGQWGLLDFGDVILHIFNGPVREEYDLERLWPEAPRLEFDDRPENLYGRFELDNL